MNNPIPIKVLVVDDSALVRKAITQALARDREIEVVGTAADPYIARDQILALKPDVLTLDLEMPRMDGLTFLRILQQHHPIPVIVISSLSQKGSTLAFRALEAGAVDVLGKPSSSYSIGLLGPQLALRIKAAFHARHRRPTPAGAPATPINAPVSAGAIDARQVIAIGASTGGVEAIKMILPRIPAATPGIVIVQHIPPHFSRMLAEQLDSVCPFTVKEAADGDPVKPGLALIAPGDYHLAIQRHTTGYVAKLSQSAPVHHCRPAVDVLLESVANVAGSRAVGAILTGMGNDGAAGLLKMRQAGARTLAQDEESSIVYGMPRAALENGAAEQVVDLDHIPEAIFKALNRSAAGPSALAA